MSIAQHSFHTEGFAQFRCISWSGFTLLSSSLILAVCQTRISYQSRNGLANHNALWNPVVEYRSTEFEILTFASSWRLNRFFFQRSRWHKKSIILFSLLHIILQELLQMDVRAFDYIVKAPHMPHAFFICSDVWNLITPFRQRYHEKDWSDSNSGRVGQRIRFQRCWRYVDSQNRKENSK